MVLPVWKSIVLSGVLFISPTPVVAQLVPDRTLGRESSVVSPNVRVRGALADLIEGGAIRDANLFHSFLEFNVGEGQRVYFDNPDGIARILTRVTGSNLSEILGTLGVNGGADLFLINPNGIVFGPNARLDLSGSFIGSTAGGILFNNNVVFSTRDPQAPPLLTINIPLGLQIRSNPGEISVQGNGHGLREDPFTGAFLRETDFARLAGSPGQTLALVGGEVRLEGGSLEVESGRVELAGVGGNSIVSLTPIESGWSLGYEGVNNFQDVRLSQAASVNTSGISSGDIRVQGQQVSLTDGSLLLTNTLGAGSGGSLTVNATESVELAGVANRTAGGLIARTLGNGNGADITVTTTQLRATEGGRISTSTLLDGGQGGNVTVNASESIEIVGRTANQNSQFPNPSDSELNAPRPNSTEINLPPSPTETQRLPGPGFRQVSGIFSSTYGEGKAGEVTVTTQRLLLQQAGQIDTSTFGNGDGGNVTVNAAELVEITGGAVEILERRPDRFFPSGIFTEVNQPPRENPDKTGNGGNLNINTARLIVREGGAITTLNEGNENTAGNIHLTVSEQIEIAGVDTDSQIPSRLDTVSRNNGSAGEIKIETGQFIIQNGARVRVSATGTGNAGDLTVKADAISLDQRSLIEATIAAGEEGDIKLEAEDIRLRRNSNITTDATNEATGGNIFLETDTLVALENSDITANAVDGAGGNIEINTQGIFLSADTDITATSRNNTDGTVQINLDADPSQALVQLSSDVIDPNQLIATSCLSPSRRQLGRFVVTGAGGLPTQPNDLSNTPFETFSVGTNPQTNLQETQIPELKVKSIYQLEDGRFVIGKRCPDLPENSG